MDETTEIRVADLKRLVDLYPRSEPSSVHVRELADALRLGAKFPPLIVAAGSNEIVDGLHRWSAYAEVYGHDFGVPCIVRSYSLRAAIFRDAVRENEAHGLRFTDDDRGRCVVLAARLRLQASDLIPVLCVTVNRMKVLRVEHLEQGAKRIKVRPPSTPTDSKSPSGKRGPQKNPAHAMPLAPAKKPVPAAERAETASNDLALILENNLLSPLEDEAPSMVRQLRAVRLTITEFLRGAYE